MIINEDARKRRVQSIRRELRDVEAAVNDTELWEDTWPRPSLVFLGNLCNKKWELEEELKLLLSLSPK